MFKNNSIGVVLLIVVIIDGDDFIDWIFSMMSELAGVVFVGIED